MLNKFIRYWNQNRGKVIIIIAVIAFIIILVQILDNIVANTSTKNEKITNVIKDTTQPIQSGLTGQTVSEEKTQQNTNVIKQFVDYCNNKDYTKAYEILTDECKNEFNNNINLFISNYCNKVFGANKTYNLELWIASGAGYTYKVKYYENNILATGGSNMDNNIEDYITITRENKININGFITEEIINKTQTVNDIEITINSRKMYKNYETYNISVKNNSSKTILLSDGKDGKDICLIDQNNTEYSSFIHEIPSNILTLEPGYKKTISARFNKIYDIYRVIEKIEFKNIILDNEQYQKNPNDESIGRAKLTIEI